MREQALSGVVAALTPGPSLDARTQQLCECSPRCVSALGRYQWARAGQGWTGPRLTVHPSPPVACGFKTRSPVGAGHQRCRRRTSGRHWLSGKCGSRWESSLGRLVSAGTGPSGWAVLWLPVSRAHLPGHRVRTAPPTSWPAAACWQSALVAGVHRKHVAQNRETGERPAEHTHGGLAPETPVRL